MDRDSGIDQRYSLRVKILIVAVAILISSAATVWVLSVISYRTGISRTAARLQAYKAEQFAEFIQSQLELLEYLDLRSDPSYMRLAERSMRTFAFGMLRSPAELILLLRENGELVFATNPMESPQTDEQPSGTEQPDQALYDPVQISAIAAEAFAFPRSWGEYELGRKEYIGELGHIPGSGLGYFVATDSREFYREQRQLTIQNVVALIVLSSLGGITIALVLRSLLRPLSDVAGAMREVAVTKDFTRTVTVHSPDEIGVLAVEFNRMTGELGAAYRRLKEVAETEQRLRAEVTHREYETLEVMGRATEYKDPETGRHIIRVGIYAALIAAELGESEEEQDLIRHAAPLHDIGKLGIPDSILLKPTALDPSEHRQMTEHTQIAHDILKDSESKYLQAGALIALTHHEHWDGSGYPRGLKGEEIPLPGRIVGLVDVFDALVSRRPYKDPWSVKSAVEHIVSERGAHFDPAVVDAFLAVQASVNEVAADYRDDYP